MERTGSSGREEAQKTLLELAAEERGVYCIDNMTTSMRMAKDQSHMTERILELTLEIIYLLTGEDYKVMKNVYDESLRTSRCLQETLSEPPPHGLTTEDNRAEKILEVTKKKMELLTGEVPISCQSVSVEEYLEGDRDLYKDIGMESEPPLTSPDGSSKRNPPERCPRPLYSRDSTQEDLTVPHEGINPSECDNDLKEEIKEEEEEFSVMEELLEEHKDPFKDIMVEPFSDTNPPERCPRPLYSRDSTQEDLTIPHHDRVEGGEELEDIKVEVKEEEEKLVGGAQQSMEEGEMMESIQEEPSLHMDTNGRYVWNSSEGRLLLSSGYHAENNGTAQHSPGVNPITHERHYRTSHSETSMDPSNPEESSDQSHHMTSDLHLRSQGAEKSTGPSNPTEYSISPKKSLLSCSVCALSFTEIADLLMHHKSHKSQRPHACSECGKGFDQRGELLQHQRIHTGERPYSCTECGKSFYLKKLLLRHQKNHTGERPFSCSECGKSFIMKNALVRHQKIHTGERPFSCSYCGKCFIRNGDLINHERIHTGECPHSCPECGKSFCQKGKLIAHQRRHTGERPFSCSECGKRFIEKSDLLRHHKVHTGERPFLCSDCGKCFAAKATLLIHQRIHTGE